MPRDDVILSPLVSAWSVRPDLAGALAATGTGEPEQSVLVVPLADGSAAAGSTPAGGSGPAREALTALGLDADAVLATHEPATKAGAVTTVPLPPGEHAVRRVLHVGTGDASDAAWRTAGAAVGRA
ncbi:MAG TPA: hypothetical protein VF143_12565, partial [Candidatus Nanopelagicales bacterium]